MTPPAVLPAPQELQLSPRSCGMGVSRVTQHSVDGAALSVLAVAVIEATTLMPGTRALWKDFPANRVAVAYVMYLLL